MVYVEIKKKAKDAVLMMVEKEREGELVDRSLVKNILGIYIEVREGWATSGARARVPGGASQLGGCPELPFLRGRRRLGLCGLPLLAPEACFLPTELFLIQVLFVLD
jgi:hypothetical protein